MIILFSITLFQLLDNKAGTQSACCKFWVFEFSSAYFFSLLAVFFKNNFSTFMSSWHSRWVKTLMLQMLPRAKSHFRGYLAFITIQPPLSELEVAIKYLNNCSAGLSNLIMLAYFSHVANKSGFMIVALGFLYFNDFWNAVL